TGKWYDKVRPSEVWELVSTHPAAQLTVRETKHGGRWIEIVATDASHAARFHGPLDAASFARLQQSGRTFRTQVEGRDYDLLGWPVRHFPLVTLLGLGAGLGFLLRMWRTGSTSVPTPN